MTQTKHNQSPKLSGPKPRILLLTSQYFIMGEIEAALKRLEVEHHFLNLEAKEMDLNEFVQVMVSTISDFKPDFVLTVNHLGVDREGVLLSILDQLRIPLVSWFVDNPQLILGAYNNLNAGQTILFTWDADTVTSLQTDGFLSTFYLPLGADPYRFTPEGKAVSPQLQSAVSFVGNSMKTKTEKRFAAANPTYLMVEESYAIAKGFMDAPERTVKGYMKREFPPVLKELEKQPRGRALAFETYLTWLATGLYRRDCLEQTMPYKPLLVGDDGWKEVFKNISGWRYHSELSYYDDLPDFYRASQINFNCTSKQMKGACNQRVFDVPCCGAFLLTDHREQIEDLFEPGKEIAIYQSIEEIPALIEQFLNDAKARNSMARAGRKRVLAEHTYDHRMVAMLETIHQTLN